MPAWKLFSFKNTLATMSTPLAFSNPRAACYLNAALQLLLTVDVPTWGTSPLAAYLDHLRSLQKKGHGTVISAWSDLNKYLSPYNRYKHEQEDAHEMLMALLDTVRNDPLVNTLFGLKTLQIVTCMACSNVSYTHGTQTQITVDNSTRRMSDVFRNFGLKEFLGEYKCDRCASHDPAVRTQAEKSTRVQEWPPYLLFHVIRFDNDGRKVNSPFVFPVHFQDTEDKRGYVLDACVLHSGTLLQSGHFKTVVRLHNPSFLMTDDDSQAARVDIADLNSDIFQKQVYLLLYRQVKPKKN